MFGKMGWYPKGESNPRGQRRAWPDPTACRQHLNNSTRASSTVARCPTSRRSRAVSSRVEGRAAAGEWSPDTSGGTSRGDNFPGGVRRTILQAPHNRKAKGESGAGDRDRDWDPAAAALRSGGKPAAGAGMAPGGSTATAGAQRMTPDLPNEACLGDPKPSPDYVNHCIFGSNLD